MERPVKGDVVIIQFPFSDLSGSKRRPALVLNTLPGDDVILCKMTSKERIYPHRIPIADDDFAEGGLTSPGILRLDHIFTADRRLITGRAGILRKEKMRIVTERIVDMLRG